MKRNLKNIFVIFIAIVLVVAPFYVSKIKAENDFNVLKIYNTNFNLEKQISLYKNTTGYFIDTIDLGGDGQDEILISPKPRSKPWVKILRGDGSIINEFQAYNENFSGGVIAKGCDLDGDGKQEIVTAPYSAGGAHIRVFDGYGKIKINPGFFAFPKKLNTGVQIGCADINGDGKDEIIAVGGGDYQTKELKIFNNQGKLLNSKKLNLHSKNISIASIDLGSDEVEEILISGGWLDKPLVQIYRADLSLINEFLAYNENFTGGVNIYGYDIDGDNRGEIITTAGVTGGSHIRIFDGYGKEKITQDTFLFSKDFFGGLSFALGDIDGDGKQEILTASQVLPTGKNYMYKYIDIDVSDQTFKYYQNGYLLGSFQTSTGKPSTPTRIGVFDVISKYNMAYGYADGVKWGMPYFIGFYKVGNIENGIHELPFLNGRREGIYSLGHAVSHGCVRLKIGVAKEIYDWVEVRNTKVIVSK